MKIQKPKIFFLKIRLFFVFFIFFLFIIWMFFSVLFIQNNKLSFGGSSSVFPMMINLQNKIKKKYFYSSSGSSAAVRGVLNGIFDIGFVSKEITNKNLKKTFEGTNYKIEEIGNFKLAEDVIIFLINLPESENEECFLDKDYDLETEIIKEIYKGNKTWNQLFKTECKEIEWTTNPIKPINRQEGSGTRTVFEEQFMGTDYYQDFKILKSGSSIFKFITKKRGSFGYISKSKLKNNENLWKKKNLIIPKIDGKDYLNPKHDYNFKRPFIGLYLKKNKEKNKLIQEIISSFKKEETKKLINNMGFNYVFKDSYIKND